MYLTYTLYFIPDTAPEAANITPIDTQWMDVQGVKPYPVFNALKGKGTKTRSGTTEFTYPEQAPNAYKADGIVRNKWVVDHDATLVSTAGHLHPGGLWTDLTLTRDGVTKRIFRSRANYFEPAGNVSWDVAMSATTDAWKVNVKKGDILSVSATYDTSRSSWYEVMGIMVVGITKNPVPGGVDPFDPSTGTLDQTDYLTHGRLKENIDSGVRKHNVGLRNPIRLRTGPFKDRIIIKNFLYNQGDLSLPGKSGLPPAVRQGHSLTFVNEDAPLTERFHTITACRAPCNLTGGIGYPLANGAHSTPVSSATGPRASRRPPTARPGRRPRACSRGPTRTSAASPVPCAAPSASRGSATRLIVVEQQADAPAGLLGEWARERGAAIELLRGPDLDVFPDAATADAVVALGSDRSVHASSDPWIAPQLRWLRESHEAGVPVLGICFGAQAFGGRTRRERRALAGEGDRVGLDRGRGRVRGRVVHLARGRVRASAGCHRARAQRPRRPGLRRGAVPASSSIPRSTPRSSRTGWPRAATPCPIPSRCAARRRGAWPSRAIGPSLSSTPSRRAGGDEGGDASPILDRRDRAPPPRARRRRPRGGDRPWRARRGHADAAARQPAGGRAHVRRAPDHEVGLYGGRPGRL